MVRQKLTINIYTGRKENGHGVHRFYESTRFPTTEEVDFVVVRKSAMKGRYNENCIFWR